MRQPRQVTPVPQLHSAEQHGGQDLEAYEDHMHQAADDADDQPMDAEFAELHPSEAVMEDVPAAHAR